MGFCSQHHRPRTECDPDSRHTQPLRASDRLMRKVEAKAASLGLERNAGLEAALEAWTDGVDEDAASPLAELLAEVRGLRAQMGQVAPRNGTGNQFGPPRTAIQDAPPGTAVFRSTDPEDSPDVIPYPVPEPADHGARKGRAPKCGHHVPAGTRCKICEPAK